MTIKFWLGYQHQFSEQVRNLIWIRCQYNVEESVSVSFSDVESLLYQGRGGNKNIWRLENNFYVFHSLKLFLLFDNLTLDCHYFIFKISREYF